MQTKSRAEELILITDKPHIALWYHTKNQWLYADWKGDQSYETVKDGGTAILEEVIKRRVKKILNDNTRVTSAWSEASNEGGTVWFPTLASAGVAYFAWIYSSHPFSQLSADLSISCAADCPTIAVFSSRHDAEEWLLNPYKSSL